MCVCMCVNVPAWIVVPTVAFFMAPACETFGRIYLSVFDIKKRVGNIFVVVGGGHSHHNSCIRHSSRAGHCSRLRDLGLSLAGSGSLCLAG